MIVQLVILKAHTSSYISEFSFNGEVNTRFDTSNFINFKNASEKMLSRKLSEKSFSQCIFNFLSRKYYLAVELLVLRSVLIRICGLHQISAGYNVTHVTHGCRASANHTIQ